MKNVQSKLNSTKRYGLIGHPLSHTLSPAIHESIMEKCKIKGSYKVYDIPPENCKEEFVKILKETDGFNVTIPYKEKIIPLLNSLDDTAKRYRAVNTVTGGRGYNTDIDGLRSYNMDLKGKKVLLLGAGGAARVMFSYVLERGAKELCIAARDVNKAKKIISENDISRFQTKTYAVGFERILSGHDAILNATPVGMWPDCDGCPVSDEIIKSSEYVFDSIYNPVVTKIVLKSRSFGIKAENGLGMLVNQAIRAQKIWNPQTDFSRYDPSDTVDSLKKRLLKDFPVKIVLTGFMGSGKTTAGQMLAKSLDMQFKDLDEIISKKEGKEIPRIFKEEGEQYFREKEKEYLFEIIEKNESTVLATGGGTLVNRENAEYVRKNKGFIIYLEVCLDTALKRVGEGEGRPLLNETSKKDIQNLFDSRLHLYKKNSDVTINGSSPPEDVCTGIKELLMI